MRSYDSKAAAIPNGAMHLCANTKMILALNSNRDIIYIIPIIKCCHESY